jgi:hypothetical protein
VANCSTLPDSKRNARNFSSKTSMRGSGSRLLEMKGMWGPEFMTVIVL